MSNQDSLLKVSSGGAATGGSSSQEIQSGPIRSKIEALSEKIKSEGAKGETGKALREKAVALILKNAGSPEWKDYMNLFGFSGDELQRLMPDENASKNVALAYLVGNGPCGAGSTDTPTHELMFGVTDALDET